MSNPEDGAVFETEPRAIERQMQQWQEQAPWTLWQEYQRWLRAQQAVNWVDEDMYAGEDDRHFNLCTHRWVPDLDGGWHCPSCGVTI